MIYESIHAHSNARILINLDRVSHITLVPGTDIILEFGSSNLRLKCGSVEAAQKEYAAIKQTMLGSSPINGPGVRMPRPTRKPTGPQLTAVGSIRNDQPSGNDPWAG